MAILITEDGAVRYVNENDVNRTMFPNLTGAIGDEQYDALNGRLVVVEGKVSNLEDCCDNVNNDITQLNEDLSEKASIISDTASGAIASFPDGAEGNASAVVVSIESVQDLNGYDSPWPAGGGENILDPNIKFTAGTYYDTTLATNDGYTCTRSGTATSSGNIQSNTIAIDDAIILPAGTYTSTGAIFGLYNASGSWLANKQTGTWTVDESFYVKNVYIQVVSGTVYANTFFISLASGSTACSAWTPYSNICPISGWTGANVVRTGKNLIDISTWTTGALDVSNGTVITNDNKSVSPYIFLKSGTYTLSRLERATGNWVKAAFYDYSKVYVNEIFNNKNLTNTFTLNKNGYIRIGTDYVVTESDHIQLELGSTATSYEPYTGQTISVNWQSEAGTVYGGSLNVTTGVLTVDKGYKLLNGVDDSVVSYRHNGQTTVTTRAYVTIANKAFGTDNFISSEFSSQLTASDAVGIMTGRPTSNGVEFYIDVSVPNTTNDIKAWFANNPVQLVYELAEPQTYQLTPQEVSILLGDNNLWADTGDISVTYPCDTKAFILKKIAEALA